MVGAISRKASAFVRTRGQQVVFRPGIPDALLRTTVFFALLLATATATADTMPWTMSGTSCSFLNIEESSATDPLPLFGEPTVSGNELLFKPQEYFSYSEGLAADVTDSHLTMTVTATSAIKTLVLSEVGDYTLVGAANASANASVSTPVTLLINNDSNLTLSTYMTFSVMPTGSSAYEPHSGTFTLPADSGAGVLWQGTLTADIAAFLTSKGYSGSATEIYLSLDDVLDTSSTAARPPISRRSFSACPSRSPQFQSLPPSRSRRRRHRADWLRSDGERRRRLGEGIGEGGARG